MGIILISILIVSVLAFLVTLFFFKRFRPSINPYKNPFYWITAIVMIPIIYVGLLSIWFAVSSSYPERSFDKRKWADERNSRYEYVDDLVKNKKLIGLTSLEVKSMLGEPDSENDSTMTFYIGYSPKYFFNSDPDWLELEFNTGQVYNSRILQ